MTLRALFAPSFGSAPAFAEATAGRQDSCECSQFLCALFTPYAPLREPSRFLLLIAILTLCALSTFAQEPTITAEGKVLDALTRKGVKARIQYKSIPTGSITGRFNDSIFSFSIFGSSKYQIVASADGYIDGTAIVDPKTMDADRKVVRNIILTKKGASIVLENLIFAQGKATINPESFPSLDEVVVMLKEKETITIQLEGHTDNQGSGKLNLELSQDRVDNVKKYFVSKGIAKDRIKTKAFGGSQPLAQGNSQEARARNRRVEMRILTE
jgi:outer membrane protein OmpA-like peptidoglycan-associated protein